MSKVFVIGAGAAGMMAAVTAAQNGHEVHIFEQNEKLGKKLYITGKGRCNLTNACDIEELFASVQRNEKFLYSAFYTFTNDDVLQFFEKAGCPVKIERGNRAFPVSDHASDVIRALAERMKKEGVVVHLNSQVSAVAFGKEQTEAVEGVTQPLQNKYEKTKSNPKCTAAVKGIRLADGRVFECDAVIVTTGGVSYPSTGARGDGYVFAAATGHSVTQLLPSLVPFETAEAYTRSLQGLSLRNVELSVFYQNKEIYREFGEMLFTHFGVSGPLVLSASSRVGEVVALKEKKQKKKREDKLAQAAGMMDCKSIPGMEASLPVQDFRMEIDLKPALDIEQLEQRVLREFEQSKNRQFKNILGSLFPNKLIPVMIELSGILEDRKINTITKEERRRFLYLIKHFPLTITALRSFREAIITKGGVSVKDINPSTMESKRCRGLYFAGEVLDLDALTGGFNLQIAWSTGYLAGSSVMTEQ